MKLPEVGTLFQSRYRLDSVLGAGGFATVFKATDVEASRTVAIKVLRPEVNGYSGTVRSRFEREVQVIARLRDPQTIKLFEYGTSEHGLLFMVTEYVPGEDLLELLRRRGRLEPAEVVYILQQVLSSLREAHAAGLLHRDIKPANIRIYSYMGDALRVKVLDFGIAKPLHNDKQAITAAGEVVGTLRYMSPEQLLSAELSASSDIYSLGVVAFEMLLGSAGIHGSRLSDQMDRLVTGHVFSIPELQRIGPELSRVLDKMAARDQSQRYRTADEVLAALQHVPRASLSGPLNSPSWSGVVPQPPRRSEELLPPITGPHTGPVAAGPSSGVRRTTGTLDIPRPIPMTDPAFALPHEGGNRRMAIIAAALLSLVLALGVVVVVLADDTAEPPPAPVAGTRSSDFIKAAESAPQHIPAIAPEPVVAATDDDAGAEPAPDLAGPPPYSGCGDWPRFVGNGALGPHRAYIPSKYDPDKAHPLVVMLHENFESPEQFVDFSELRPLAEKHGFVIIAPLGRHGSMLLDPMAWKGEGWTARVASAIETTRETLCIDPDRIFGLGHAAGGLIIENSPCDIPVFRAIATTSYRSSPEELESICEPSSPIPYLHLAPLRDGYNPVEGGESCSGAMKISLKDKEAAWRSRNHCGSKRSNWMKHRASTCFAWDCEAAFVSCHLDGGRPWPRQTTRFADAFSGNNCDGKAADFPYAETIWKFFEQHGGD